jgi:hypothetical protein
MSISGGNPQVRLKDMSTAFIQCGAFGTELPVDTQCCPKCHTDDRNMIYVRPFQEGCMGSVGNTDWDLCIEGIVCCGIYDFVRALPREWWVGKSRELGVGRDDGRGYSYTDTPHRNTEHTKKGSSSLAKRPRRIASMDEDEPEGLSSWMNKR